MDQQQIELWRIRENPNNARRYYDPTKMEEMTASVKTHGIRVPLLLRPVAMRDGIDLEVVYGHRRRRAAVAAGLKEVPAQVESMDDERAQLLQLIENVQREDLHPLEEADALRHAHEGLKQPLAELALQLGKSPAYVHQRIALARLPEESRQAVLQNKISLGAAMALTRIHDLPLLDQALTKLLEHRREEDPPVSAAGARRFIEQSILLRLKDAPFDRAAAALVPAAGPCTTCPYRTGAQAELFGDIESPDLCRKPSCYKEKVEATWLLKREEAVKAKVRVIEGEEAKELFDWGGLSYRSPFVDLDDSVAEDPKHRTYRQLLGEQPPVSAVARDPETGNIWELLDKKAAAKALKKAGHDFAQSEAKDKLDEHSKKQQERDSQRKQREKIGAEAMRVVMEKADTVLPALWGLVVAEMESQINFDEALLKAHGLKRGPKLAEQVAKMELKAVLRLVLEMWLTPSYYDTDAWPVILVEACGAAGVDLDGIAAEMAPKPAAPPEPKAPKAKAFGKGKGKGKGGEK